ncbi:eukaryotic translation initiation factor 4B2-like [Silene latifolia]|uniref:eukaryotic translation initiation factor 4B2-like n=1 Tax=Silene latifolia TaxID=37657 RepID=UPI003D783B2D
MSSKPWGGTGTGIGSWAADAELAEAEEQQAAATAAANPQSFPSLKESVTTKPKKKKMTLSEFYSQPGSGSATSNTRLTPDEMFSLPTGPKLRSPDEYVPGGSRLGGGFSNYGGGSRDGPSQGRRGGFDGGFRRGDYDSAPPPPPSRADEVDDWGAMKRSVPMERERERERERDRDRGSSSSRYGALGGGSRADEVDNWSFEKKPLPLSGSMAPSRSNTFGSGNRDSGSEWRRDEPPPAGRPRLVLEPRRTSITTTNNNSSNEGGVNGDGKEEDGVVMVKVNKGNPFGAARPREEVLADKGLDWKKMDSDIEAKKASVAGGSRPSSSQGSRPTSSQSNRSESVAIGGGGGVEVKARPKVNPFGDAKPREVLLEQKGLDWRKIDLQLEQRRVDRPETEEEKTFKEEIEILKKDLENAGKDVPDGSGVEEANLRGLIESKERNLEILIRELDDKVRFGQKPVERPGSGAGRPGSGAGRPSSGAGRPGSGAGRYMGFQERPPPRSETFNDYRGAETMDRPRSRGTGDNIWTRPGEDRRGGFQGNRDRGFVGNRDFNRSTSRERW